MFFFFVIGSKTTNPVSGVFIVVYNRQDKPRWDIWWGIYPALAGMLGLGNFILMEVDGSELKLVLGLMFFSVGAFKFGHMAYETSQKLELRRSHGRVRKGEMKMEAVELHNFAGSGDDTDSEVETEAEALQDAPAGQYSPGLVWSDVMGFGLKFPLCCCCCCRRAPS